MLHHEQPSDNFGQNLQETLGLRQNAEKQFEFVMPRSKEIDSATAFALEALHYTLDIREKMGKKILGIRIGKNVLQLKTSVKFIATKNVVGYFISIAAAQLFDTALADMLDTFGDVGYKAAIEALIDAKAESSTEGKRRHRHTAEGLLRLTYAEYEKALQERENRLFGFDSIMPKKRKIQLHDKAVSTALIIAAINQDIGLQITANKWADNAKKHFDQYTSLAYEAAENGAALNAVAVGAGAAGTVILIVTTAGLGTILGGFTGGFVVGQAGKKIMQHANVPAQLAQQRERFNALYARLVY